MRIVIALGGNALLRRGEVMSADNQRCNVRAAVEAIAPLAAGHELLITHGNGPQVGLLALQSAAGAAEAPPYPLDLLDAETEGMVGYLIEQELGNLLPERACAALLTQIRVDPNDPAFKYPTKPIGPVYEPAEAQRLAAERGWTLAADGNGLRRVVASPYPQSIVEIKVIDLLVRQGVIVICAGGGGIPVVQRDDASMVGVEAVIDKDFASALLAREVNADALLMLTDVEAVYRNWGEPHAQPIRYSSPEMLSGLPFAAGSMGPKIQAACEFVARTRGFAGIGRLQDAAVILDGKAGTLVCPGDE